MLALGSLLLFSLSTFSFADAAHGAPRHAGRHGSLRRHNRVSSRAAAANDSSKRSLEVRGLPANVPETKATWYSLRPEEGGYFVHCDGTLSPDPNSYFVAMNTQMFDMSQCGQWITITADGKTTQAQILDSCPTCPTYGQLDMSEGLMRFFDPNVGTGNEKGVISISWSYGGGGGGDNNNNNNNNNNNKEEDKNPESTSTTPEWTPEPTPEWTPEPSTSTTPSPTPEWTPEPSTSSSTWTSESSSSAPPSSSSAEPSTTSAPVSSSLNATSTVANSTAPIYHITALLNLTTSLNGTATAPLSAQATVSSNATVLNASLSDVTVQTGNSTEMATGNIANLQGLVATLGRLLITAASS